ncbi:hypothetical protein HOP50_02g13000 [Chloropicon primus]|uniref:RWD domain-containing protein n=2 Tax=Chloropicon primus TaxID=1764295 RepID=A0A5B8MDY0_9CHLO|nr:hypothetical protein A3770_02p13140 [Chloropicon primus]UPQ98003.1 hypothetical protein HOP50_02g13000 [Chloropicon primus]|eukprot:QDZ18796.1 hypothetical protein A3770_02p13140 [Chloropicon primus]
MAGEGGGVGGGGKGEVESLNDVELEMHRKWNVSFKKKEAEEEVTDERRAKHLARLEEEEVRRIAQEALRKQEERERLERERNATASNEEGEEMDDRKKYILQVLEEIKGKIPDQCKAAFTSELVQLNLEYSERVKVTVKASFPKGFSPSNKMVHCDVESKSLHEDIVGKLLAGLQQHLEQTFGAGSGNQEGENPIGHIYQYCDKFLGKNHLLTAYEEIQRIKKEILKPPSKVLGLENKQGVIKVRVQVEKYYVDLKVKVFCKNSVDYPDGIIEVGIIETNLTKELEKSFLALTEARIRLHGDAQEVVDASMLEDRPPEKEAKSKMKKKVHPRKVVFQTAASKNTEAEMLQKQEERERERLKKLLEDSNRPKVIEPRIFIIVEFVYKELLKPVVESKCPCCDKKILPSDPKHCAKIPSKMKADRLYCGHFYHHHCLTNYLSNPPFDDECHICGAQISHHKFVDTKQQLEKRWAQKQARQREIEDLEDLFGF